MKNRILITVLFLLLITSITGLTVIAGQQYIVVRIINPHTFPVVVHSQNLNAFGNPYWVEVTYINPKSYIDIPNVPVGSVFGIDSKPNQRFWPPFQVYLVSDRMPNYIYQVPR